MMQKIPTVLVEEAAEVGAVRYMKRDGVMRVIVVGIGYLYGLDPGSKPTLSKGHIEAAARRAGPRLSYFVMQDVDEPRGIHTVKRLYNTFDEAWESKENSDD
jgi:hypothetical protein